MFTFTDAVKSGFKNYFNFSARATRYEFWVWLMFTNLVSTWLNYTQLISPQFALLGMLFSLVTFIPGVSLSVRRLHDIDRSGWWCLLILTGVGVFVLLYWFVQPSQAGDNRFGEAKVKPNGLTFRQAVALGNQKLLSLKGRVGIREYFFYAYYIMLIWALALFIVTVLLLIANAVVQSDVAANVLLKVGITVLSALSIIMMVLLVTLMTRRLHDINKSGWWQLLVLTVVGTIPLQIWTVREGDEGPNRYGELPIERQMGAQE